MDLWHEDRLLIDGELVAAEGGATYPSINPATGEEVASAADASLGDTERAIAAARRAFDETDWATDVELRTRCLRQMHEGFLKEEAHLRALMIAEVGVPEMLTHGPGLDVPTAMVEWYANLLDSYEFTEDLGEAESALTLVNRMDAESQGQTPVRTLRGAIERQLSAQRATPDDSTGG